MPTHLTVLIAFLSILAIAPAYAASDEFSPRFTGTVPAALADTDTDLLAEGALSTDDLNRIAPAAGISQADDQTDSGSGDGPARQVPDITPPETRP